MNPIRPVKMFVCSVLLEQPAASVNNKRGLAIGNKYLHVISLCDRPARHIY